MDATFVKEVLTHQTGGNVMVDTVELHNGMVLSISDDIVLLYPSMAAWHANEHECGELPSIVFPVEGA